MSSSTNSPPPETPADPSPPVSPLMVSLPKPPSFSAHRGRGLNVARMDGDGDSSHGDSQSEVHALDGKPRTVTFDVAAGAGDKPRSPNVYRIPQRSPAFRSPDTSSDSENASSTGSASDKPPALSRTNRAPPPRSLSLSKPSPLSGVAPAPLTAPATRMASAAASRGISIAPALARGARSSMPSVGASIWSAGLVPQSASGWISPALQSARSVGTSARQRGLTVAVLREGGGDIVVESGPMTPGLGSAPLKSAGLRSAALSTGKLDSASLGRKEKTLGPSRGNMSAYPMLSPRPDNHAHSSPDPTSGTFAQAQAAANLSSLSLKDADLTQVAPGEAVAVIDDATGEEVVGHVFMMSGGGKGPAGKSKAKFKTVPCKDFAEGYCPYGEYCSFIHDWANMYDPAVHGPDAKVDALKSPKSPALTENGSVVSSHRRTSSLNAWAEALPQSIKVPAVKVDAEVLDKNKRRLSAFAAPFTEQPLRVDNAGQVVALTSPRVSEGQSPRFSDILSPRTINPEQIQSPLTTISEEVPTVTVPNGVAVPAISEPPKANAWARGPPAGLKRVSIAEPQPATASGASLVPPSATYSLFGTESDPATPWDPALRAEKIREAEEDAAAAEDAHAVTALAVAEAAIQSASVITDSTFAAAYPSPGMAPYAAPTYPWGMPMSPVGQADFAAPQVPGGLGVMWTPAGWAVQDAAMKHALRSAQVLTINPEAKRSKPKSYYRTRPCKFFADGFCPHGDSCTYSHIESGGADDGMGSTKAAAPATAPKSRRTIPCKFFNSALGCVNGDNCNFLHVLVVPDAAPLVSRPRPWRTRPCRHFQTNTCTLGDACHFAHVVDPSYREASPCQAWAKTGRCDKGAKCRFRHDGEGGEANIEGLTEERLAQAFDEIRRTPIKASLADDDDDDDDVEIVTIDSRVMSPARSVSVAA